ncbi:MAG: carbohydrate ABC transporter permease [Eubacterium sp.]|nr:carbohydrate ABC transporter permease [Eubacterium sp.]
MAEDFNANLTAEEKRGHAFLIIRRIIAYIVLIVVCLICIFPFITLIINMTKSHAELTRAFNLIPGTSFITNFKNVVNDETIAIVRALGNSLLIGALSCIITVYISSLTAYGLYAYEFKLKKAAYTFIMIVLMVPTQVSALGYVEMVKSWGFENDNSIPALIFPAIAVPGVFFFIHQYMESALPLEIVEAGRIDGGHEFYIFNFVVMPILKPAIAVQLIFSFVASWNNYFLPQLLMQNTSKTATLPLAVAALNAAANDNFDLGKVYMVLGLAIVPLIIVYLCLSKYIIRGIALGSVKG